MSLQNYQQLAVVTHMHRTPRFGHTNSIAVLASSDEQEQQDYIKGVKAFSIFLIILISTWLCLLLVLKYGLGRSRVGCAAGGGRVDVTEMREQKISRSLRRQSIVRNWRVRNVFLFCTLLLPALSFVFINQGLTPFVQSLKAILELNKTVRAKVFRGLEIAQGIDTTRQTLSTVPENFQRIRNQVSEQCPNVDLSSFTISSEIQSLLKEITAPNNVLTNTEDSLFQVINATNQVAETVAWINAKDWWLKLLLLALNVVNCFFVLGAFLVKIGVDYYGFQLVLSYCFLPLFAMLILASVLATGISASGAMMNADFCAGSPMTTFQQVVVEQGYEPSSFVYRTVDFYVNDCTTTKNPLQFLRRLEAQATIAADDLLSLAGKAGSVNVTELSAACNGTGVFLNETQAQLTVLAHDLAVTAGYLRATDDLTECSSISPVLRDFAYGATCTYTVESLTWMFSTMLCITLVGMTMLSTRAALFNIITKPRKRKRREREFQEYKEFMKQYYDTSNWELDPGSKGDQQTEVVATGTFETEETAKISPTSSVGEEEASFEEPPSVRVQFDELYEISEKEQDEEDDSDYSSESSEEEQPSIMSLSFVSDVVRKFGVRKKQEPCLEEPQKQAESEIFNNIPLATPKEESVLSGWTSFFPFTTPHSRKKFTLQDLLSIDYGDPDGSFIQESVDIRSCASSVADTSWRATEQQQERTSAPDRQSVLRLGSLLPQDREPESDVESIFTSNEEEELRPLTPSPHRHRDTFAPRKALSSLARTIGGSKL